MLTPILPSRSLWSSQWYSWVVVSILMDKFCCWDVGECVKPRGKMREGLGEDMLFTWDTLEISCKMTDMLSVDLASLTAPRKNIWRALSVASSELVYTEKASDHRWIHYRHFRVLTTTKAEKECDINEGIASSKNLRHVYVSKTFKYEEEESTHRN